MKYTLNLKSNIDIPEETSFVLIYQNKRGETKVYPILEIINQNYKYLRAEIIGKGPRTFFNHKIVVLTPVKANN